MANEMRGEIRIEIGGAEHTVKFNMNTIRLMLKHAGRKLSEIQEWFSTDHLDAIMYAVFAGLQNSAESKGEKWPHDFERTAAMLGDLFMDEDEVSRIADAMLAALGTGKQTPGANPATQENQPMSQ